MNRQTIIYCLTGDHNPTTCSHSTTDALSVSSPAGRATYGQSLVVLDANTARRQRGATFQPSLEQSSSIEPLDEGSAPNNNHGGFIFRAQQRIGCCCLISVAYKTTESSQNVVSNVRPAFCQCCTTTTANSKSMWGTQTCRPKHVRNAASWAVLQPAARERNRVQ